MINNAQEKMLASENMSVDKVQQSTPLTEKQKKKYLICCSWHEVSKFFPIGSAESDIASSRGFA